MKVVKVVAGGREMTVTAKSGERADVNAALSEQYGIDGAGIEAIRIETLGDAPTDDALQPVQQTPANAGDDTLVGGEADASPAKGKGNKPPAKA